MTTTLDNALPELKKIAEENNLKIGLHFKAVVTIYNLRNKIFKQQ